MTLIGLVLFFFLGNGSARRIFVGMLMTMAGSVTLVAGLWFIRCRVCGRHVGLLEAPYGAWWSYLETLGACPKCDDDGEARPVAPGQLSAWYEAAREVAARHREEARTRNRRRIRNLSVGVALAVATFVLLNRCGGEGDGLLPRPSMSRNAVTSSPADTRSRTGTGVSARTPLP